MDNSINEVGETRRILTDLKPLNEPRIMIQVGASEGNHARSFVKAGWNVYAFDAAPVYKGSEELAKEEANPCFHFYNMAIALKEEKSVTFYESKKHPSISSLSRFHTDHQAVEVPAVTLSTFYQDNSIKAIDYFMIDAETMDLQIMKTHDWSIPISALMMECTPKNVMDIYSYIMDQNSAYKHIVFDWRKPEPVMGIHGVCHRMCVAEEFAKLIANPSAFGNILFYLST